MKKNIKQLIYVTSVLFVLGSIFGCSNGTSNETADERMFLLNYVKESKQKEQGSATVKMFVPDYYAMAAGYDGEASVSDSRAIAPQTSMVQLDVFNSTSDKWNLVQLVDFSDAKVTPVESAVAGFPGSIFELTFDKVYAKNYAVGELRISLLNSSSQVITMGTNTTSVTVQKGKEATTTFFTVPESYGNNESSLAKGEMKFVRYTMQAGTHYTLHVDTDSKTYPDAVVFAENGTFENYYSISKAEDSRIDFGTSEKAVTKYVGIWADEATVSSYSVNLYADLADFTFKDSSIGFWAGEEYKVNLSPVPSDACIENPVFTSSNANIKVSQDGIITCDGIAEGVVTVTCKGISHTIAVNAYETATELSGVLSGGKLHWTKENSPYKVTGNILIEEDDALTIDPGVKVYFNGYYYIKMNGTINAVGTKEEPIILTKAASYTGTWDGLRIGGGSVNFGADYTYLSGNILKYVDIAYAETPVSLTSGTYVEKCNFVDCANSVYIQSGSVLINNNIDCGIRFYWSSTNNSYVINNIINKNLDIDYSRVKIANNTINSANIYIYPTHDSSSVVISGNDFNEGLWRLVDCNSSLQYMSIQNNNFNNYSGTIISTDYSHDTVKTIDFKNNYWGQTQTEELIANEATGEKNVSFISDYRDNFNYTEVDYTGWRREPVEGAGYQGDSFDLSTVNFD